MHVIESVGAVQATTGPQKKIQTCISMSSGASSGQGMKKKNVAANKLRESSLHLPLLSRWELIDETNSNCIMYSLCGGQE